MKILVYFDPKKEFNNFEGARLRKTIKGALEMINIEHTSNLLDSFNIVNLISYEDEKIIDEAKEYNIPVVISALYTEDDPDACYIEKNALDDYNKVIIKPKAIKVLNKADLVLVPNVDNVRLLKEQGVTTDIKVVAPGINMARFDFSREDEKTIFHRYYREDPNKKLVLAVGEYNAKMNGLSSFINAANKCPNTLFYYVGRMSRRTKTSLKLKRYIKQTPANVKFITSMPDDVYRSALINASVFMVPGYKKVGVIPLMEAMASKCQIIARKSAIFPEFLEEGKDAYIGEFSETLSSLVKDYLDDKLQPTTIAAYENVSKRDLTKYGEELKDIYMDLINKKGGYHNDWY